VNRVPVRPELLSWALHRAGLDSFDLVGRFPKLEAWLTGEVWPTLRQLEQFARSVHVPVGYLFLPEPPREQLPIPDFRTLAGSDLARPSPNLLDTIYLCQQRQDWYRDYARMHGLSPVDFVAGAHTGQSPEAVAEMMREALALSLAERRQPTNWTETLRQLIAKAEGAGVLVMAGSIVGGNPHRKLNVDEFRGFALADALAPVVFINAADAKAAQMFTLAHELAHLCLGKSGISDPQTGRLPEKAVERWCNAVAAEFLVPAVMLQGEYRADEPVLSEIQRLARRFKVSTLVVLRRLFDLGFIDRETLRRCYQDELDRIKTLDRGGSAGGDFYRTLGVRTGKTFARAVVSSALEGQTLFQDAFRMLGVRKSATFFEAARHLGVMP
jgi:Zn-dependent peptidase ImmA (M78 family)